MHDMSTPPAPCSQLCFLFALAAVCAASDERVAGLGHGLWAERRVQLPVARVESAVREAFGEALDILRVPILLQVC